MSRIVINKIKSARLPISKILLLYFYHRNLTVVITLRLSTQYFCNQQIYSLIRLSAAPHLTASYDRSEVNASQVVAL